MTWGGRCPYCHQVFRGKSDGKTMGEHRTDMFLPFSNRREHCPHSGSTREDAERRIPPRVRHLQEFVLMHWRRSRRQLAQHERDLLKRHGLLEETLEMMK